MLAIMDVGDIENASMLGSYGSRLKLACLQQIFGNKAVLEALAMADTVVSRTKMKSVCDMCG